MPSTVLLAAFLLECVAFAAAVGLSLLSAITSGRRGNDGAAVRVVLIHGFAQTQATMSVLARRLAAAGFAVVPLSYGSLRLDIPGAAERLRRLIGELQEERMGPVHLVAFGIGGLVARYCVRRHRVPGVRRVVTLGTPHLGTLLAPKWPEALARLRPESDFLRHLAAADRAPEQFESTAIQSEFDATILPPENANYPAAFNVVVRDTGHFTMLFSRRVFRLVLENLEESR